MNSKLKDYINTDVDVITTSQNVSGTLVEVNNDCIVLDIKSNILVINTDKIVYFNTRKTIKTGC